MTKTLAEKEVKKKEVTDAKNVLQRGKKVKGGGCHAEGNKSVSLSKKR